MELINKFRELGYRIRTQLVPGRGSVNGMILMFHRVVEELGEYRHPQLAQLHVTTRHLEHLIVGLREQGYEIISLDGLCHKLNGNQKKAKFVVFTFDDAYRDTYELAYPIFRKHAAPFTVYVPTAVPDNNFIWWYYMLDDLVYRNESLDILTMQDSHHFEVRTEEQKRHAYKAIENLINSIDPNHRRDELARMFARYGLNAREYDRKLSMSWAQLGELSSSGFVTIGGHTVNHYNLAHMTLKEATNEIILGKKRLEEKLDVAVDHFSYPFGSKSAAHFREFDLARSLGYKTCTTSRPGYITQGHCHYTERLPRIMVNMQQTLQGLAGN